MAAKVASAATIAVLSLRARPCGLVALPTRKPYCLAALGFLALSACGSESSTRDDEMTATTAMSVRYHAFLATDECRRVPTSGDADRHVGNAPAFP